MLISCLPGKAKVTFHKDTIATVTQGTRGPRELTSLLAVVVQNLKSEVQVEARLAVMNLRAFISARPEASFLPSAPSMATLRGFASFFCS